MQGQDVTYVTERCVMRLTPGGPMVTEVAPGVDLERDVLAQVDVALKVATDVGTMPAALYRPGPTGLTLRGGGGRRGKGYREPRVADSRLSGNKPVRPPDRITTSKP